MLRSFLMGLVGGQRAFTPLAVMSVAAARGRLPADTGAPGIIAHPLVAAGLVGLAVAELAGDKMKSAPDRIVPIGLFARLLTSSIAGAALSTRENCWTGAALAGATAVVASYPGWRTRMAVLPRYGRVETGLVEDAMVVAGAVAVCDSLISGQRRRLVRGS